MRVLHLANSNSTNVGHGALIFGTERVLKEDWGNVDFKLVAWDDYTFELKKFDEDFVRLVNKHDVLLVSGAVTFNGRKYLKNAGMRLDLPYELWPRIKKPIVFYGVSYRVWPNQPYHNLDQLKRVMRYLLSNPRIFFGVRNDGTKGWLENLLGYQSEKIVEIPDPGLYVPVKDSWHPQLVDGKTNILIALNNEDEVQRFGGKKERFLENFVPVLVRLAEKFDVNFILCPHYLDDYKIIGELIALCPPRLAHQLVVSTGLLRVPQSFYFYDLYAKVALALSMRVHSMSPAIGLGTPVVPLVSQARMTEFLKKAGLLGLAVDVFDSVLTEKVYRLAVRALSDKKRIKQRLQRAVARMREQTRKINQQILEIVRK